VKFPQAHGTKDESEKNSEDQNISLQTEETKITDKKAMQRFETMASTSSKMQDHHNIPLFGIVQVKNVSIRGILYQIA